MATVMRKALIPIPVLLFLAMISTVGCVGPTTPFGPLSDNPNKTPQRQPASKEPSTEYKIDFHPEKQVLHDKTDFSIEVSSNRPLAGQTRVRVTHNGYDVTESFLAKAHLHKSSNGQSRIYMFKDLRLKTLDANRIRIQLVDDAGIELASRSLESPDCSIFGNRGLAHLGDFHAPENYIPLIEKVAESKKVNASFVAGVVAQESGFNPKAVSWAKAIGLTQITPLAEKQLLESLEEWPRYPGINSLSYLTLKSKIHLGEIDDETEWRLNPEKSLVGGVTYFQYLKTYWDLEDNRDLVNRLDGDRAQNLTDLILASYNSGAARVKRALIADGPLWRSNDNLKEAARYIKKVSSFCFHYSKKGAHDDDET